MSQDPPAPESNEGTMIGQPIQDSGAGPGADEGPRCSNCGQPLEADSRFCQACGTPVADGAIEAAQEDEKPRPWFFLVTLLWAVIAIVALYFLYSRAIVIGG